MNIPLLIFVLMLSVYATRALPAIFVDRLKISGRTRIFLELIPITTMSALIFPSILTTDPEHMSIGLIGGLAALIASWCKAPIIVSVLIAIAAVFACYTFGFVF